MLRVRIEKGVVAIAAEEEKEIEAVFSFLSTVVQELESSRQPNYANIDTNTDERKTNNTTQPAPSNTSTSVVIPEIDPDDIIEALREMGRPAHSPEVYEVMLKHGTVQPSPDGKVPWQVRDMMRRDPRIGKTSPHRNAKWVLLEGYPHRDAAPQQPLLDSHESEVDVSLDHLPELEESERLDLSSYVQES